MTLSKSKKRTGLLFPWNNNPIQHFLNTDSFLKEDFFTEDSLMPAMNVKERKNDFEIEFAAPGFSKKEFEISIDDNVLNVCGEKSTEKEENEADYTRKEFSYNSFKRSLALPEIINSDEKVKATYKDGILKLNLLKRKEVKEKPKKLIEIV